MFLALSATFIINAGGGCFLLFLPKSPCYFQTLLIIWF